MSMSYDLLHEQALKFVPEVPIKDSSTWIAILIHTISQVSDIKDKTNFLWIKCHGRITVRTLKHEYFSRHPLEDFELKFMDRFVDDSTQVTGLRQYQVIQTGSDHRILVLRAFEEDAIDEEEELEVDAKLAAKLQRDAVLNSKGEKVFVIDDDGSSYPGKRVNGVVNHSQHTDSNDTEDNGSKSEEQSSVSEETHEAQVQVLSNGSNGQTDRNGSLEPSESDKSSHHNSQISPSCSRDSHISGNVENTPSNSSQLSDQSTPWESQNDQVESPPWIPQAAFSRHSQVSENVENVRSNCSQLSIQSPPWPLPFESPPWIPQDEFEAMWASTAEQAMFNDHDAGYERNGPCSHENAMPDRQPEPACPKQAEDEVMTDAGDEDSATRLANSDETPKSADELSSDGEYQAVDDEMEEDESE